MTEKIKSPFVGQNNAEVTLIKSVFANNERLLKLIRSLFFGLSLTSLEKETIRGTFKGNDLIKVFTKRLLPSYDLDRDTPIGQTLDLWAGVQVTGQSRDAIYQAVFSRKLLIELTKKALALLENPNGEQIDLSFEPYSDKPTAELTDDDYLQVKFVARNSFLNHIETQLGMIKLIADQPIETIEETRKRIAKDSAK